MEYVTVSQYAKMVGKDPGNIRRMLINGTFPKELSKTIRLASENREKADYLDFFIASREEAEKQIQRAENFLESIKLYLTELQIL